MKVKNKKPVGKQYLAIFVGSTFLVLFFILQNYFISFYFGKEFDLYRNTVYQFSYVYAWVIFTPLIIFFSSRFKLEQTHFVKNLAIHIIVAVLVALLHRCIFMFSDIFLTAPAKLNATTIEGVIGKILAGSFDGFVVYWLILGAYLSFEYYREYKAHQLISANLEVQLAQAQVQALRMQLQPHFLFNTLHAISSLMDDDIKTARKMLARLSDLLRQTLDNIGIPKIKVEQELDFLKKYLEIEQTRFSDRLSIQYEIDSKALQVFVPNLILQPLVENAIKHGIVPLAQGGRIQISVQSEANRLILCVIDNGKGTKLPEDKLFEQGLGLSSIKNRLDQMYGTESSIEIKNTEQGFSVCIRLPIEDDGL